jgi:hypothetical protein
LFTNGVAGKSKRQIRNFGKVAGYKLHTEKPLVFTI